MYKILMNTLKEEFVEKKKKVYLTFDVCPVDEIFLLTYVFLVWKYSMDSPL